MQHTRMFVIYICRHNNISISRNWKKVARSIDFWVSSCRHIRLSNTHQYILPAVILPCWTNECPFCISLSLSPSSSARNTNPLPLPPNSFNYNKQFISSIREPPTGVKWRTCATAYDQLPFQKQRFSTIIHTSPHTSMYVCGQVGRKKTHRARLSEGWTRPRRDCICRSKSPPARFR